MYTREPVRPAAVAGLFYPQDTAALRTSVQALLAHASDTPPGRPKALVVPHAGYVYSGATAARAYATVAGAAPLPRRVVLMGPAHRVPLRGIALSSASAFATPMGDVRIDRALREQVLAPGPARVAVSDDAHALEHSLEVQLPFLQATLGEFSLLPLVVGDCAPGDVAAVLQRVWGDEETLLVVSTDLSHFHDYAEARRIDAATVAAVESLSSDLSPQQACGCRALNGLCRSARRRAMRIRTLATCNSGDTAGPRERVVGYAAFALYEDLPGARHPPAPQ